MPSSKSYLDYVLDLLRDVEGVTYKKMMGEYILYSDGVIFGGIYDNRFLVKKTDALLDLSLQEEIPYPSAKPMLLVDSESPEIVKDIVMLVINSLKWKETKSPFLHII